MTNLILKSYDTYPPVATTLTDTNGAINLSTATAVKFVAKGMQTATIITGAAAIVNAAAGQVQYAWGSTDTQTPDTYAVEWQITWNSGGIQKVPNAAASNEQIEIDADLNASLGLALCVDCGQEAAWRPSEGNVDPDHPEHVAGAWVCPTHGDDCHVNHEPPPLPEPEIIPEPDSPEPVKRQRTRK